MRAGETNQRLSAPASSGALAGPGGELELLQPEDAGGYDPYNSSGRFPRLEHATATSPLRNESSLVDK